MSERFWDKVDCTGDCWPWIGATNPKGKGLFKVNGKTMLAHHFALESSGVVVPKNSSVMHLCETKSCCNPAHLYIGSYIKLSPLKAYRAKQMYYGGETIKNLAKLFGVSRQAMANAIHGRTWKDAAPEKVAEVIVQE